MSVLLQDLQRLAGLFAREAMSASIVTQALWAKCLLLWPICAVPTERSASHSRQAENIIGVIGGLS
ncbi:hypothetical protein ATB98_03335 [Sinorhizobium saheli]|uniref:Uncharacterized protein n=1 Tax=Sinorhizobium saheli TaxID=36856 RepID=A0A178YR91_SINSA|nr:hypothetical protein ATB98_03335 [Sinorhizobium saheli]